MPSLQCLTPRRVRQEFKPLGDKLQSNTDGFHVNSGQFLPAAEKHNNLIIIMWARYDVLLMNEDQEYLEQYLLASVSQQFMRSNTQLQKLALNHPKDWLTSSWPPLCCSNSWGVDNKLLGAGVIGCSCFEATQECSMTQFRLAKQVTLGKIINKMYRTSTCKK